MRKRACPWSEGHAPQVKCHVSERDITKRYLRLTRVEQGNN